MFLEYPEIEELFTKLSALALLSLKSCAPAAEGCIFVLWNFKEEVTEILLFKDFPASKKKRKKKKRKKKEKNTSKTRLKTLSVSKATSTRL